MRDSREVNDKFKCATTRTAPSPSHWAHFTQLSMHQLVSAGLSGSIFLALAATFVNLQSLADHSCVLSDL